MAEIKKVHTPCRGCSFAVYDGQEQIGCELGRIKRYREIDPELVMPAYDEEGREFFVINGRTCPCFRREDSKWALERTPAERKVDAVEDLRLKLTVAVNIKQEVLSSLADMLRSLAAQSHKPALVLLVHGDDVSPAEVNIAAREALPDNPLTWRMVTMKGEDNEATRLMNAFGHAQGNFLMWLDNISLPDDACEQIDNALDEGFNQVVMFDGATPVYHIKAYKSMLRQPVPEDAVADTETPIQETASRLRWLAEQAGNPTLIQELPFGSPILHDNHSPA